ncbi:pirin family protein [Dysgonomonas sp. Marseille-P4361]|uniref:pirin family protein n=1 Tax=Dysgonomonas sp. Marseille-P4361 TaxID=2161820 RepID=UPI000D558E51|nr:pirin family protein [Dysgonomonas sp. Marseille-P4361]
MKIKSISQVARRMNIRDPFILASNIYDKYPEGNGNMAPKSYLAGRQIGSDFSETAPWRMYHGNKVPGFPQHPHRGFEIVTIVPEGLVDHFDSKGSKGRYGNGDVQLMSAGRGAMHSEMFPLLNDDKENSLRLFQIWINLPAKNKLTEADYKMLWAENIPVANLDCPSGGHVRIKVILGEYYGVKALGALKNSWAADPKNHLGIALIEMDANTEFKLENISSTMNRFILYYEGDQDISIEGTAISQNHMVDVAGDQEIVIKSGDSSAKILLLEGEPINEPIAAYGPFVMNTEQELVDAFEEYRRTEFGGWPWGEKESDIINDKNAERFASYQFGKIIDKPQMT